MVNPAMEAAMIGPMCSLYGKTGLNMAGVGFIRASQLFRALLWMILKGVTKESGKSRAGGLDSSPRLRVVTL